ncbi:hypothetical protein [Paenibacillus silvisoli]|uniref:hypothetical protein n=1 Tax=Paenibacillus silvisoli TaxID=3110539 RepID=UPI0028048D10|nr:hypothetical protein [Paenibacillus silvisoli]
MNKWIWSLLALCLLLSACSSKPSWEEEQLEEESHRILDGDVEAIWTVNRETKKEHPDTASIRLELTKRGGDPIESFDLNHEKLLHLMVVSEDLSFFSHIHPEYKGKGRFEIEAVIPAGGKYRLIADFKPAGGDSMTKMTWVTLDGPAASPVPVEPDKSLIDEADGATVSLKIDRLAAKADTTLTFDITDTAIGQPVTDLQPYLGAIGHVVVLSENGEKYVHVHAEGEQGSGPTALFETSFPGAGIYKIWAQFQREGRVFTVSYAVDVPADE